MGNFWKPRGQHSDVPPNDSILVRVEPRREGLFPLPPILGAVKPAACYARDVTDHLRMLLRLFQVAANHLGFGEVEWDSMRPSSGAAGSTLVRQNAKSTSIGALALETGGAWKRPCAGGEPPALGAIDENAPANRNGESGSGTGKSIECVAGLCVSSA